jgi:3-dehydroquinate dehydratase/shikimate dehydrogenase
MSATGAGVIKIASQATCLADNLRIARLLNHAALRGINLAALAMGRAGTLSRVLGPHWGSWMTFASSPGGEPAAEGQIPADVLVEQYRLRQIGPQTELYGVLGKPLVHSLSPLIHNAAFAARGKDALMLPLEASSMEDFLAIGAVLPIRGASVTLPYKEKAYQLAGSLSVQAQHTGAVNTLIRRESGWHGDNTDIEGFIRPLKRRVHPGRMRAVVLGAGGGSRAVVYGLKSQGAAVCVVARDEVRARLLAEKFQAEHAAWNELPNLRWNILVNATPVGMYPGVEDSPVPAEWLSGEWVYDLVYNPAETRLLREAAQRGCRTISGIEMFLTQAAKQQALWCGLPIPEERMEQVLRSAIAGEAPQK